EMNAHIDTRPEYHPAHQIDRHTDDTTRQSKDQSIVPRTTNPLTRSHPMLLVHCLAHDSLKEADQQPVDESYRHPHAQSIAQPVAQPGAQSVAQPRDQPGDQPADQPSQPDAQPQEENTEVL